MLSRVFELWGQMYKMLPYMVEKENEKFVCEAKVAGEEDGGGREEGRVV